MENFPATTVTVFTASADHSVMFFTILPRIEQHGRAYFCDLRSQHASQKGLQEMRALA